jgi:Uma2 family endonuclease
LRVVPDLVVEVLSTSTASHDRGEKKATYGAAGVREYWLLDGRAREVIAYVLENGRYGQERAFTAGAARSLVLAGLVVDVAGLFP